MAGACECGNESSGSIAYVKCTLVQALRLCTGRTAHRESRGIAILLGKGKVHPCTGTEALYRLYGP